MYGFPRQADNNNLRGGGGGDPYASRPETRYGAVLEVLETN